MEMERIFESYLKELYGKDAKFREDQLKAIVSTVTNHATLVVEKTGWGKSLIYFLATKYLRKRGSAPSLIVSPLKSLMRNQREAAEKLNMKTGIITGDLRKDKIKCREFFGALRNDFYGIVFVTPEQLSKEDVKQQLISIDKEISLIAIDEVHCLSEWGHDFRPDFMKIRKFVQTVLSRNPKLHLLATTATANDLVISDLERQFEGDTETNIIRGSLTRESLHIYIIQNLSYEERYAWILQYLKKQTGSGIVYCLTVKDCELLALFLKANGIDASAYHSESEKREFLEDRFNQNIIKVLVATTALGMGYDKADISFVIHFQRPTSILEYYQQIGRAGRGINDADAILLTGIEDDKIAEFFRKNAFPDVDLLNELLKKIESTTYVKEKELQQEFNLKSKTISSALKQLEARDLVIKDINGYSRTANKYNLNEYIEEKNRITDNRIKEIDKLHEYVQYSGCLMQFISEELNDPFSHKCGRCQNCTNAKLNIMVEEKIKQMAYKFINQTYIKNPELNKIEPRKQINRIKIEPKYINKDGYFLCKYNIGIGRLVKEGKYKDCHFSEKLVNEMSNMIITMQNRTDCYSICKASIITFVPSLRRPSLVKDFAIEVANKLGIICVDTIEKIKETDEQKMMQNSEQQQKNLTGAFRIREDSIPKIKNQNVYIVDDMVDSRWTFTICGGLLLKRGLVKSVTPLAIADTSNQNE